MSTNNKRPEIKQHRITQQQKKKKKKKKKKKTILITNALSHSGYSAIPPSC
jgi:hypothetical protein